MAAKHKLIVTLDLTDDTDPSIILHEFVNDIIPDYKDCYTQADCRIETEGGEESGKEEK